VPVPAVTTDAAELDATDHEPVCVAAVPDAPSTPTVW
jgi:hypothetical protein